MGKLFCIMGKSSSGKDTLYKQILEESGHSLTRIISYTTRPIRSGEADGVEYFFVDEKKLQELEDAGRVIELRAYHTVHGVWKYFTVDDGQIDLKKQDYLMIATLEAYRKIREYFGVSQVIPIYIEVEDGIRLQRALDRERQQREPKYQELCRRFLADSEDFAENKLAEAGIGMRFLNMELERTRREILDYMDSFL